MRLCYYLALFIAAFCLAHNVEAQTLTEKLMAEDPSGLVASARKDGNVVRGAILFHQGNINCAKCHRPKSEADRIGPDLSQLDQQVTDALLVESILQPSKTIKKGYETASVLTLDGKVVSGLIVEKSPEKIVLRDDQSIDRIVTFSLDEIDEVRSSPKSSMPDGLANELKNRQQFLDLIRYVIDIRERGPAVEIESTHPIARRELSSELNGLVLINDRNCVACHKTEKAQAIVAAKAAPNLSWSGKWLNPELLVKYIADPNGTKPGTTMPNMLHRLDDKTRMETATAIVHFLVAQSGNQYQAQPLNPQAVVRGAELFQSVGCIACHAPRDKMANENWISDSVPLGELAEKYSLDALVAFLENPHSVRPSGRMPNMLLTHQESQDVASFLLQNAAATTTQWNLDSNLAKIGEQRFTEFNCTSCHTVSANSNPAPASQLGLAGLRPDQGCLSGQRGDWPDFHLADRDRKDIGASLENLANELSDQQQIDISLTSFNCVACHDRDDFGGVAAVRNPHFQTDNLNLGDQGRIPPTLTGVGAKLNPKWMRDVMVNGRAIRPYMKTRMPQFGEENIGHLIELFQKTDTLPETKFGVVNDPKEIRKLGLTMAGNQGLNCVACHTYQYKISDTMPAVDLTEMTERLKKDWFYQYMLVPQKFSPNTVMPSFWPGGNAIRKDIEGDPEYQIEALWQYLLDGRQARAPSGVVREPLEIAVADEAKMLRRSYRGIGKRGIGVGYPGGVNLAFDAEQLRLAMIWQGKFVDPAGVWTGQGHGTVRPIGRPLEFSKGPDLDDRNSPWIVDDNRPPNHQFKGYRLDKSQRPIFKYRFDNVDVSDFFSQVIDEGPKPNLRRKVALKSTADRNQLRFRVATGEEISDLGDGRFSIGKQFTIRIVSDHAGQLIDSADGKSLQIPLELVAGIPQELVVEYLFQ